MASAIESNLAALLVWADTCDMKKAGSSDGGCLEQSSIVSLDSTICFAEESEKALLWVEAYDINQFWQDVRCNGQCDICEEEEIVKADDQGEYGDGDQDILPVEPCHKITLISDEEEVISKMTGFNGGYLDLREDGWNAIGIESVVSSDVEAGDGTALGQDAAIGNDRQAHPGWSR